MELYYQGKDITGFAQISKCVVRDTCGDRCDSLEIEFENAREWASWGPAEDEKILVAHRGYDSGTLYVNTVIPDEGRYRILATSLPVAARQKAFRSFAGKTVEDILTICAMESGMDWQVFGLDGQAVIPYIQREDETAAKFLRRLLKMEGATLKCVNGKYTAIGIAYAQARAAHQSVIVTTEARNARYTRTGTGAKSLTVKTPYAEARAEDTAQSESGIQIVTGQVPAMTSIQAGRWARGLLLEYNRQRETVVLQSEYNAGMTAMTRIDIEGDTPASGSWLIEEAEHDLINETTTTTLHRCVTTIK